MPSNETEREDDELRRVFREAPFPSTPPIEAAALSRIDFRTRVRQATFALASAAALAGISAAVLRWGGPTPRRVAVAPAENGRSTVELLSPMLLAGPPVDSLSVLQDQQDAYLALLRTIEEE